ARAYTRGQHDVVVATQCFRRGAGGQFQFDAGGFDAVPEPAQGFVEFLLARNPAREIELAADVRGSLEQRHRMPAIGSDGRAHQYGRSGGDGCGARWGVDWRVDKVGFRTGMRIDQTAGAPVLEYVIEAGLVAGDAGVDGFRLAGARLVRPLRIGQQ